MKLKKLGALILGALLTIGVAAGIGATVEKDRATAAGEDISTYKFITEAGSGNTWGTSSNSNFSKNGVTWSTTLTSAGSYNSSSYAGQQFGSKSNSGKLVATTTGPWSYNDNTVIKEIRMWLNNGTGTINTYDISIGGVNCSKSGTISKNTSAGSDYTKASKIVYTPNTNNTGVVKITVSSSSKAWYWCALEIDCYKPAASNVTLSSIDSVTGTATAVRGGDWDLSGITVYGKLSNSTNSVDVTDYVEVSTTEDVPGIDEPALTSIVITVTPKDKTSDVEEKTFDNVSCILSDPPHGTVPGDPLNVTEAIEICVGTGETATTQEYYVSGIVSKIDTEYSLQYKNISFYISDDGGTESAQLLAYRCDVADANVISVGYNVILQGSLINFNNKIPELCQGCEVFYVSAPNPTEINGVPEELSIPLGTTYQLTPSSDHPTNYTYTSNNANVLVDDAGLISFAGTITESNVGDTATITIKATAGENLSVSTVVTIGHKQLKSISRSGYFRYQVGQTLADCEGDKYLKANWTFGESSDIALSDENLTFTVGGQTKNKNYQFQLEDNGKSIVFTYTDPNYDITKSSSSTDLQVSSKYAFTSITVNYASESNYILRGQEGDNYLTCSYVSWEGQLSSDNISITTSDSSILNGKLDNENSTYSSITNNGSFRINLTVSGEAEKQILITVTIRFDEENEFTKELIVLVRNGTPQLSNEITYDTTAQGYTNGQEISSYSDGDNIVKFKFDKGTNSNTPKYYTSGSSIRVYGGGTVTVSSENIISNISITFGDSDGSNEITTNCGTYSSGVWTGSANSVTFSIGGTSSNRRFQKFVVTYGDIDDITTVHNFVNEYMHHNDYATTDDGTGLCLGDSGYYKAARTALNSLNSAQLLILRDTFTLSYARLQAWAIANNTTFEIDEGGNIIEPTTGLKNTIIRSDESALIIILVSIVALTGFAFFYVSKRNKKEIEF